MYLMPTKRGRRLSFLPATSPAIVPRRIPAVLATARAYGLQLGSLPSANVTSMRKFTPAFAAARISRARAQRPNRRRRGLSGLGDDTGYINPGDVLIDPNYQPLTPPIVLSPSNTPSSPASGQPSGAVQQAYKNALTAQQNSQNPLDYVSPNAAIAAGLDPATVNAAWAKGVARFSTAQDAVNAGINAGVVNSLWAPSRAYVGTGSSITSWLAGNIPLVAAGIGIFALASIARSRR
jgi:hypothetical protein